MFRGRGEMRGRGMQQRGRGYNQGFRPERYYSDNDDSFEQNEGNYRGRGFNREDDDFGYQNFKNDRPFDIQNKNQGYAKNNY
jgi:hypothetical protein